MRPFAPLEGVEGVLEDDVTPSDDVNVASRNIAANIGHVARCDDLHLSFVPRTADRAEIPNVVGRQSGAGPPGYLTRVVD